MTRRYSCFEDQTSSVKINNFQWNGKVILLLLIVACTLSYDASTSSHRSEPSSLHVEDVVVTRAVFAALLRYHHELLSPSFEEKSVLGVQAVHPRALRGGVGSQGGAGGRGEEARIGIGAKRYRGARVVDVRQAGRLLRLEHVGSAFSYTLWIRATVDPPSRASIIVGVQVSKERNSFLFSSPVTKQGPCVPDLRTGWSNILDSIPCLRPATHILTSRTMMHCTKSEVLPLSYESMSELQRAGVCIRAESSPQQCPLSPPSPLLPPTSSPCPSSELSSCSSFLPFPSPRRLELTVASEHESLDASWSSLSSTSLNFLLPPPSFSSSFCAANEPPAPAVFRPPFSLGIMAVHGFSILVQEASVSCISSSIPLVMLLLLSAPATLSLRRFVSWVEDE